MVLERFRMDDQVAIVTGASRGIGAAIAVAYAEAGADVVIGARDGDALAAVAEQVAAHGRRAVVVRGSLHTREALAALVDAATTEFGRITTVVNNVGGSMPNGFLSTTEADFDAAMRWNVTTAFNLSQLAVPHMLDAGGASIVNIASAAGRQAARGFAAYGTAKAAMIALTRNMAQDLSPRVRVNAIAPGATATSAMEFVVSTPEIHDAMVEATPMKRLGEPEEIAAAAVYLASPAGAYVTGQCLAVDGGILGSNFDMGLPDL
jgi:7-alpha-hydroxysteroid dehydrogenase